MTTPNSKGVIINLTHDLIASKVTISTSNARKLIRVLQVKATKYLPSTIDFTKNIGRDEPYSCSSSDDDYHPSDNYSRLQLYNSWIVAKDTVKDYKSGNKDLLVEVYKLKKDFSISEKIIDSMRGTKKNFRHQQNWYPNFNRKTSHLLIL